VQSNSSLQQLNIISSSDAGAGDHFGGSDQVAIVDNILVIGAFGNQENSGAVYLYGQDGRVGRYTELTILRASDPDKGSAFGTAIAASGEWIAVGAPWQRNNTGAVYLFRILNGNGTQHHVTELAKISASDEAESSNFGGRVAIDGNILVVGAHEASSVYIFGYSSYDDRWSELVKLQYSNDSEGDPGFGISIDVSGDIVVVGTLNANMAFVYQASTRKDWNQVAALTPSHERILDFGYSVAVSGDCIVVGDHENEDSKNAGIVFVYNNIDGEWTEVARLEPENQTVNDWFGFSVSISKDASTIAVGSASRGNGTGTAYLFHRDLPDQIWTFVGTCTAEDGTESDEFGRSVALSEDLVFVGAPGDYSNRGFDSGSVYIFSNNLAGTDEPRTTPSPSLSQESDVPSPSSQQYPLLLPLTL
jgi:hypothetical protein